MKIINKYLYNIFVAISISIIIRLLLLNNYGDLTLQNEWGVLFNNLNTIYSYAIEKPSETPELILMLSDNLKHVLYESNAETISLEKELNF